MQKTGRGTLFVLVLYGCRASQPKKPDISVSTCDLSLKMAKELMKPDENLFFSPSSIQMALGMLLSGAGGRSADELRSAIFSGLDESLIHKDLGALIQKINSPQNGFEFKAANRLYSHDGFTARSGFMAMLATSYGSEFRQVDFVRNTEGVRQEINKWVEDNTNGLIKGVIPPGMLNEFTRLVIVNALYFKGKWKETFKFMRPEKFHVNSQRT